MSTLLGSAEPGLKVINGKRSRRSWSAGEKRRIVLEAAAPGASVAEIALRHGVNANLVFNWRKIALAASPAITEVSGSAARPPDDASPAAAGEACDFIPIGILGQAETVAPAPMTGASPAVVGGASSRRAASPRPGLDERPGVIEIDLADGTRLRVDAFVNERALRRVVAALKAAS
jgi:transposase